MFFCFCQELWCIFLLSFDRQRSQFFSRNNQTRQLNENPSPLKRQGLFDPSGKLGWLFGMHPMACIYAG